MYGFNHRLSNIECSDNGRLNDPEALVETFLLQLVRK